MFKDSQSWKGFDINQVERFFEQFRAQEVSRPIDIRFHLVSGESMDNTDEVLLKYKHEIESMEDLGIKVNIHLSRKNKYYQSVVSSVNPDRIKGLSETGDFLLSSVDLTERPIAEQYILWIESDFITTPTLVENLINMSIRYQAVVAPLPISIDHSNGNYRFYDTWAFRTNNDERWTADKFIINQGPIPMNAIGSCALIPADYINKGVNFGLGAFPELCRRVKHFKGLIVCDSDTHIFHPSDYVVEGRAI